ncbi:MAG: HPr family phosphocarrier protein [Verrucomicrobia bacterium]|nr:HPr family phosphocarrier protein [Verrucomicrobiota bacterium]
MQTADKKALTKTMCISNEGGLHARPASELVRCAMRFKSQITITANGRTCSGQSIMDIMSADIRKGAEIVVQAEGVDAEKAIAAIERCIGELSEKGF